MEYAKYHNKYNNKKIETQDGTFDSQKEYGRWCDLKWMQRAGQITCLQRQVPFELIPSQKRNGKTVERPCTYIADFVYFDKSGEKIVEDVKGYRQGQAYQVFAIKRKLMLEIYDIQIKEI